MLKIELHGISSHIDPAHPTKLPFSISYQLYFKHTDLNAALIRAFEPQQILLVALLLLLTTFTTVLLTLREINPKNLLKQLKK